MKVKLFNKISQAGLKVFDSTYEFSDSVENPDAILVRSAKLHDLEFNPELACIARAGAGVNNIPIDRCSDAGIVVFNTPGANANAVKELTILGMLLSARDVIGGIEYAKTLVGNPDAEKEIEANKSRFAGYELQGKTLLVIGLGAIGGPLANLAARLHMHVIGYDPYVSVNAAWSIDSRVSHGTDLNAALAEADYISIHIPLTPQTKDYLGEKEIAAMKDGVRIMNFARGGIINESALIAALESGKVAKYVTDFPSSGILSAKNVIAIPHLGASTEESEDNCAEMAASEIRGYLERGEILHSVNFPDCDMGALTSPARILVLHKNIPSMVSKITQVLGEQGINIENMNNRSRKDLAATILDISEQPSAETAAAVAAQEGVLKVRVIS
ncbi:MAG: 3-phosphoglycerate dehydrogenase [Firmicutes bacterium]|nr:3-phosphoglycerate dehydrogenase [Bacillota bacterium]